MADDLEMTVFEEALVAKLEEFVAMLADTRGLSEESAAETTTSVGEGGEVEEEPESLEQKLGRLMGIIVRELDLMNPPPR